MFHTVCYSYRISYIVTLIPDTNDCKYYSGDDGKHDHGDDCDENNNHMK